MNTVMDFPNIVQWESLNGFPNKGRVQFSDECDKKLAGAYILQSIALISYFKNERYNILKRNYLVAAV